MCGQLAIVGAFAGVARAVASFLRSTATELLTTLCLRVGHAVHALPTIRPKASAFSTRSAEHRHGGSRSDHASVNRCVSRGDGVVGADCGGHAYVHHNDQPCRVSPAFDDDSAIARSQMAMSPDGGASGLSGEPGQCGIISTGEASSIVVVLPTSIPPLTPGVARALLSLLRSAGRSGQELE